MIEWTAGTVSTPLTRVCPGDLVVVRLKPNLGPGQTEEDESNDVYGRPRHVIYRPDFTGGDARPGTVGGQNAPDTDPLEYRVDLAPLWCPYAGQVLLAGGVGVKYFAWFERTKCAERPPDDPTFTLRNVGPDQVPVPRGAYAVTSPHPSQITFIAGTPITVLIAPGQRFYLGVLGMGTFGQGPANGGVLPLVAFHLRF